MKFKTSALAVAAMAAVGFAYSAFAAETSYDKLGFSTNQTFSANASGTSNGSWNVTPVVTESKIEIDSDSTDRFTFTPATANTVNDATELKVKVEASVVPASVRSTLETFSILVWCLPTRVSTGSGLAMSFPNRRAGC